MCIRTAIVASSMLLATSAGAAVIRVDGVAMPGGDGSSWATALNDLHAALAAAQPGDELWIARGLYVPTAGTDRTVRFSVPANVKVYGGFAGTESAVSERPIDPDIAAADPAFDTILSGEIGAPGSADNTMSVIELLSPTTANRIDRLVIANGADELSSGGGMQVNGGSPTIAGCLFISNTALQGGGLHLNSTDAVVIEDCVFKSNTASFGAALAAIATYPTVRRTRFEGNTSVTAGGAVWNNTGSGGTYESCDFVSNITGGGYGGAIATVWQPLSGTLVITDCNFNDCRAPQASAGLGGALFTNGTGTLTVTDCTFNACRADQGGATNDQGGHMVSYTNCQFTNNIARTGGAAIFWDPIAFNDCLFQGNTASTGGAIDSIGAATATRCTFRSNTAGLPVRNGGAMYLNQSSCTFVECLFELNTTNVGGVAYAVAGSHTFDRCRFLSNTTTSSGGCYFGKLAASSRFLNCLFKGSAATIEGGVVSVLADAGTPATTFINCTAVGTTTAGYAFRGTSAITISNSIVRNPSREFFGSVTVSYSNVEGGAVGVGNIDADPLFVNAGANDYTLSPGSPCIDAGDSSVLPPGFILDLDGNDRRADIATIMDTGVGPAPVVDIGALELQPPTFCAGDANGDGEVNFSDITTVLTFFNTVGTAGDANDDGVVNFSDITSVLTNFGTTCP